jgi:hypothetical protein
LRIVLGNSSLIKYQPGGGHWSWFLQYPLGLRALGHEVLWLELLQSSGHRETDLQIIRDFFERLVVYDLSRNCTVLLFNRDLYLEPFAASEAFGTDKEHVSRFIKSSELLLNFCCAFGPSLLSLFKRRALLDFDPGHLQLTASGADLNVNVHDHEVFLTIGARINEPDSEIPKLGLKWRTFTPLIFLPMWPAVPDPGPGAPFSSITQWTWELLPWQGRTFSVSKRSAYLKYADLPLLAHRPFELAANIGPQDPANDRQYLRERGWNLVEPHQVAGSPAMYQQYIRNSRAEFASPKPIHVEMRTGWFSDRSIAYLASGRPVVTEDTGFRERLPTGVGLLTFRDVAEAADRVAEIDADYQRHSSAAREIAETFFDSRKCLEALLSACES